MKVAPGLRAEVDRLAVDRPGGCARIQVPVRREIACWSTTGGYGADIVFEPAALGASERDRSAVRRPRRIGALGESCRQLPDRGVGHREQIDRRPDLVTNLGCLR